MSRERTPPGEGPHPDPVRRSLAVLMRMVCSALCVSLLAILLASRHAESTSPGPMIAQAPHTGAAESHRPHFPPAEDLELMLRYLVEDGASPGIVLGVLEADGTRRIVSWGDAGHGARPLGPKSVFEMGSITKVFTGVLLAEAVARGELALDDPVSRHLPDEVLVPTDGAREIRLLDLATHSSALPRMPDNMVRVGGEFYPAYGIPDLYRFLSSHRLRRSIGAEWEYSNIAVALLGHVLERASGMPYEELLRRRILDPLGLDLSSTKVEGAVREWMTTGHDASGTAAPPRNWPELPAMGALRSNAEDMLAFLAANANPGDDAPGPALRAAQRERYRIDDRSAMGLNWRITTVDGRRVLGHGGGTAGFNTAIALDPQRGIGVVLLTNTRDFGDDIHLDLLLSGPPADRPEVGVTTEVLSRYTGAYDLGVDRMMAIRLEPEGWLTAQATGNERFRLYADSDTSFFSKRTPARYVFTIDASGIATGLVTLAGDVARHLPRTDAEVPPPGALSGRAAAEAPLAPEAAARYEGTYDIAIGPRRRALEVFFEEGRLFAQIEGREPIRLRYQGAGVFSLATDARALMTFTTDAGRATAVEVRQYGGVFRGVRRP